MSLKLKLNTRLSHDGTPQAPTPSEEHPVVSTPASATSTGGPKLKLTFSQPPTPAGERAPSLSTASSAKHQRSNSITVASKKRSATDNISPAAKRTPKGPSLSRKVSIKLPAAPLGGHIDTPVSAGGSSRIKLGLGQRKPSGPKIRSLHVTRPPPPRLPGLGYDSEDDDAEEDPSLQQGFVLRMTPGDDCNLLREAIANGKVGVSAADGGVDVTMKFLDTQFRRAIVTIRDHKYAAALVDLPCVVEAMKSWDRKGWWKVTDVSQMLLVLGRCKTDDEARNHALPKEVDPKSMQFPHGLTPPMHWVRKRRFRPRPSYKDMANVEEEVERLLKEDDDAVRNGGYVNSEVMDRAEAEREISRTHSDDDDDDDEMDAEGEAIETVENEDGYHDQMDDNEEGDDLVDDLQAMFDSLEEPPAGPISAVEPAQTPLADQAASMAAVETAMADESTVTTPADNHSSNEEEESDEDEDDDDDDDDEEDSPDVMDEDAIARAAERNQQLEEVADLEREIEAHRRRTAALKNQLLVKKAMTQLATLEEELRTKKAVFGLDADD